MRAVISSRTASPRYPYPAPSRVRSPLADRYREAAPVSWAGVVAAEYLNAPNIPTPGSINFSAGASEAASIQGPASGLRTTSRYHRRHGSHRHANRSSCTLAQCHFLEPGFSNSQRPEHDWCRNRCRTQLLGTPSSDEAGKPATTVVRAPVPGRSPVSAC